MNPNGLVPVIEDDGLDHVGIERDPALSRGRATAGQRFWSDDARRARARRPMDGLGATTFQPDMIGLFVSYWRTPEEQRNPNVIRNFSSVASSDLRLLDTELAKRRYVAATSLRSPTSRRACTSTATTRWARRFP